MAINKFPTTLPTQNNCYFITAKSLKNCVGMLCLNSFLHHDFNNNFDISIITQNLTSYLQGKMYYNNCSYYNQFFVLFNIVNVAFTVITIPYFQKQIFENFTTVCTTCYNIFYAIQCCNVA